eukprot:TRINITY_DN44626_c0_g1_i1.p1 TRINITY_DN44626_c0_g1~~TRINITY_DN44626_c0_g1_i1.p1  ORF type:complete len:688 (-),score=111.96 TRINITY_DN44626_c0_g1_i1:299-2260(-)
MDAQGHVDVNVEVLNLSDAAESIASNDADSAVLKPPPCLCGAIVARDARDYADSAGADSTGGTGGAAGSDRGLTEDDLEASGKDFRGVMDMSTRQPCAFSERSMSSSRLRLPPSSSAVAAIAAAVSSSSTSPASPGGSQRPSTATAAVASSAVGALASSPVEDAVFAKTAEPEVYDCALSPLSEDSGMTALMCLGSPRPLVRVLDGDAVSVEVARDDALEIELPITCGSGGQTCALVAQWVHEASEGSTHARKTEVVEEQSPLSTELRATLSTIAEETVTGSLASPQFSVSPSAMLRTRVGPKPTQKSLRTDLREARVQERKLQRQSEESDDDVSVPEPAPDVAKASEWHLYLMREMARLSRRLDRSERMAHLNTVTGFKRVSSIFAEALTAERSSRMQEVEELRVAVEELQAAFAPVSVSSAISPCMNAGGLEVSGTSAASGFRYAFPPGPVPEQPRFDNSTGLGSVEVAATLPPHATTTVAAAVESAAARLAEVVQVELEKRWGEVAAELDDYRRSVILDLSGRQSDMVARLAKWQADTLYAIDVRAASAQASRAQGGVQGNTFACTPCVGSSQTGAVISGGSSCAAEPTSSRGGIHAPQLKVTAVAEDPSKFQGRFVEVVPLSRAQTQTQLQSLPRSQPVAAWTCAPARF